MKAVVTSWNILYRLYKNIFSIGKKTPSKHEAHNYEKYISDLEYFYI